jgi:hypothetical protein
MRCAASLIFAAAIVLPATQAAAQSQGPCFFTQPNYKGDPMCVAPTHRLPTLGPAKNKIMSVQVPAGVRVTVCDLENYSGSCQTLSQSTPDFTAINAAGKVGSVASETSAPRPPAPNQAAAPPANQGSAPPPPAAAPPPAKQAAAPPPPAAASPPPPAKQGSAPPPPPPDPATAAERAEREAEYIRELRRQLLSLRKNCEDGEKTACVRLGFIIGENRARRTALRQENPELFWWDK